MSRKVADIDLKKLWGRAAGHCSLCEEDLLPHLESSVDVIGEMAHVIGYKKDAARGDEEREYDNSYDNLILLCPTCHEKVDNAPKVFTVELLHIRKHEWEEKVAERLNVKPFESIHTLCSAICRLLAENHEIWKSYGPESQVAKDNPLSNMAQYWELRKLDTIVPNNKKIVAILKTNEAMLPETLLRLGYKFKEHSLMFERNCYAPIDNAARFPVEFEKEIMAYAKQ